MFGVDSLSTHSRIRYRSCVRQTNVMYYSSLRVDRWVHQQQHEYKRMEINFDTEQSRIRNNKN